MNSYSILMFKKRKEKFLASQPYPVTDMLCITLSSNTLEAWYSFELVYQ